MYIYIQLPSAFPPPCLGYLDAWVPWWLCCFVALLLGCLVAWLLCCFVALLRRCFVAWLLCCLRIAFGRLVGALWIAFSWLLATFWKPFGTFWTPWATFFGPRDDSGPISGPGCKKLRKSWNLVELWWLPGAPIWDHFGKVDDFLADCFLLFFWTAILLTICCSGVRLGSKLWCFLGYLGPLEIGLERWRGYDFHTLGLLFGGTNSKLDREGVFSWIFTFFVTFWTPFGECFGTKKWKKEAWKNNRKNSGKVSCKSYN